MKRINYLFKDETILLRALTHSSYRNEHPDSVCSDNERLEFLGDALLDFVVGEELFNRFPESGEGYLSRLRAEIVNEKNLSSIARDIGLGSFIRLGRGEEQSNGAEKHSILADALESLIAAVYLDGGISEARDFISRTIFPCIDMIAENNSFNDFKTLLQEFLQKRKSFPEYRLLGSSGPDHSRIYRYAVVVDGQIRGEGESSTKKGAQQLAAKIAIEQLRTEEKS